ncbi:dihydrodipicolinate synthase family protein [Azorhizobium oxalatiphilum]|uniref:Dihydrodipicolinate synthase family protein n=2 Tax=Azorhizobium oxalatiphilum TaxID=980631 RepID=A0A917C111_9HYPH|nr:dihydrodipicolinate synthase family protein [Azorhizobium oxalatiphilum]GGF67114.1 dihydrodipicolinate synthase family protein [Azorhizobium oxalatiphilum]
MPTQFKGLSAFPITPADPKGRVDTAAVEKLVGRLAAAKVDSIGLLGSTGTYAYLSRAERRRALDAALPVAGDVPVLVGVGALRTDEAVKLAQDAKAAGAAAGLLAAVSYTPLTEDEVYEHFVTVQRESGLPLCIYDNPGTTHFRFTPELVRRLSRHEGIVGVKSPSPEAPGGTAHLAALRAVVPEGFPLGYSGDWNVTEVLIAGGDAWFSVMGGLFPHTALALTRAAQGGDATEARALNARLEPLWALFRELSSLRVMYAAAGILGLTQAEPPRPILPLGESARARVAETLKALNLS